MRTAPRSRHTPPREDRGIAADRHSSRRLSYAALLVAAGLTGVYAETIPNFEIMTLVVFCSGVLLGARDGAMVGGISMLIFSLLNPYGPVHPLVTIAQVTGTAAAGWAGALAARAKLPARSARVRAVSLAAIAIPLTLFFDLITNAATGVVFGQMRLTLIGGIPFSLWHVGYNIALFAALGTPLVAVCGRYATRLSS